MARWNQDAYTITVSRFVKPDLVKVFRRHGLDTIAKEIDESVDKYGARTIDISVDDQWTVEVIKDAIEVLGDERKARAFLNAYLIIKLKPASGKVKKLELLPKAMMAYLAEDSIDGWVYRELSSGIHVAYVVEDVQYYEGSYGSRGDSPPYVSMCLKANRAEFSGEGESNHDDGLQIRRITWSDSDLCYGATAANLLLKEGYLKENEELKAQYAEELELFRQYRPQEGKQFLCTDYAVDASADDWWGRKRSSDEYKLIHPQKMVNDEGELGRKITLAISNSNWHDYGIKENDKRFTQVPVHPLILFFDLTRHQHSWVHVTNCKPYVYDKSLKDKLVLPVQHRELVDVLTQDLDVFAEDIIAGKSGGTALLCYGAPGLGKAQPLDSKVQTPSGPVFMRDVKRGTLILAPDGSTVKVLAVYDQGVRPCYLLTFADGRTVKADKEHLWKVKGLEQERSCWDLCTSEHLSNRMGQGRQNRRKPYVPLTRPIKNPDVDDLPLDPWFLGILLGDGFFKYKHLSVSTNDIEIVERIRSLLPLGYTIIRSASRKCDWRITMTHQLHNSKHQLRARLSRLGLYGLGSHQRFIPDIYKNAGYHQRMELLRGLIDSDAYVSKDSGIIFSTTSSRLASDVQEMVWAVGGTAKMVEREGRYKHNGEYIRCRNYFDVSIRVRRPRAFAWLPRKRERLKKKTQYTDSLALRLESITPIAPEETRCLLVDHPDHLYLTDNYVVTHNTLTSEVYSELIEKPLYRVHAGQLGTDVSSVENELEKCLRRAERWQAVMLIDEADVYIRQRGNDIHHNAVVAAFLRTLEYFHGLLFMTTNRIGDVDDAILSRMVATFKYETPDEEMALRLWQVLGKQFGMNFNDTHAEALVKEFPTASGRDIKQLLKLTLKYCKHKKIKITLNAFRTCALFRGLR